MAPVNLYTHKDSNIRKTWFLMTMFLVIIIALGYGFSYYYGAPEILYFAVVLSVGTNIVSYWFSDKIAIAMSGARPITREQNTRLYRIVENLSITAGLPLPRLHIMSSSQINAFATGRNPEHAAVAVTIGALDKLNDNELEGVIAHELSHIGNRDILISTVAVVMAGLIAILADWFLRISFSGGNRDNRKGGPAVMIIALAAAILAPLAATMIRMAVSRKREYLADASGALITRYPEGLASALEKMAQDQMPLRNAHNATAHLFIASPFKGGEARSWLVQLFSTHPPVQDRIKRLRQ